MRAVQEMLGHESITTTEIYTHLDRNFLRDTLNRFHPDFKKVTKQLSQEKRELYLKPEVIQYFELEKVFQDDLNLFLSSLSQSVSDYIKTPNKLGIVTQGGSCHVR